MAFSEKKIRVVVASIGGVLTGGTSSLNFTNLPIEADIEQGQLPTGGAATIKIYGVSKQHMDAITTIQWKSGFIEPKAILVFANEGDGEHLIYSGSITSAVPCYDSAPEVYIKINSCTGAYWNTMSEVPPYSHKGMTPVHLAITEMCAAYGVVCKNNGVLDMCNNPRFSQKGLKNRLAEASRKFNIDIVWGDGITPDVNIFPKSGYVAKTWKFTKNNYVGYPSFNACGVDIKLDKLYYDLDIKDFFIISGSEVSAANGSWKVQKVKYNISTKLGGNWLMSITGQRYSPDV